MNFKKKYMFSGCKVTLKRLERSGSPPSVTSYPTKERYKDPGKAPGTLEGSFCAKQQVLIPDLSVYKQMKVPEARLISIVLSGFNFSIPDSPLRKRDVNCLHFKIETY